MKTDVQPQGALDLPREAASTENVNEYKFEPIQGYPTRSHTITNRT
jgi:hypothetical protein